MGGGTASQWSVVGVDRFADVGDIYVFSWACFRAVGVVAYDSKGAVQVLRQKADQAYTGVDLLFWWCLYVVGAGKAYADTVAIFAGYVVAYGM